jgi:hypothetical protein
MTYKFPFRISAKGIVLACSLLTLNSGVYANTVFRKNTLEIIFKDSIQLNSSELPVSEQAKLFQRFDKFKDTQIEMNNQLIQLNMRQEQIFKQLEKNNHDKS